MSQLIAIITIANKSKDLARPIQTFYRTAVKHTSGMTPTARLGRPERRVKMADRRRRTTCTMNPIERRVSRFAEGGQELGLSAILTPCRPRRHEQIGLEASPERQTFVRECNVMSWIEQGRKNKTASI